MNDTLTGRVEHLVTERTGLKLRPQQRALFRVNFGARLSTLNLRDEVEYCRLLSDAGPVAEAEWQFIARLLTNKETYFFRDKGQIALLRNTILPELIENNRSTQTLRIWSAGCSTGEEAYTLGILVHEQLPSTAVQNWDVTIIGTDIDSSALKQARQGAYGSWSFRTTELTTKQRHFHQETHGWQVSEPVRSSVVFKTCNLLADSFPSYEMGIYDIDLVLCRNVFIYFEHHAVAKVLDKFAETLRPGGFLMTGHVETRNLTGAQFTTRNFPDSEVYQKRETASPAGSKIAHVHPSLVRSVPRRDRISAKEPAPVTAPTVQTEISGIEIEREQTLLLEARNLANMGQYAQAVECCNRFTREFPFSARPYEVLALIALDRGLREESKAFLKKALYLSSESPHLYMELGALYLDEGDEGRAEKMRLTALELLRTMAPQAIVGLSDGPNVRECIEQLTQLNKEGA